MMELNEFIEKTINEICDGIYKAKQKQHNVRNNSVIAPGRIDGEEQLSLEKIHFELLVEINEEHQKKGGAKINVFSFNTTGEISKADNIKNLNKITFDVPLFPQGLSPVLEEE